MHNEYYQNPYYCNVPVYNPYGYPYPQWANQPIYTPDYWRPPIQLRDYGPNPYVVNIEEATLQNKTFRTALWTGNHLQLTLMSINVGDDIGLEMHPCTDQFIRIEKGEGLTMMGDTKDNITYYQRVYDDYVILIPAGKWHNLANTGCTPLKLYSIYAPPEHPQGTIHQTKQDAEQHHRY